jgi:mannose-6-phosphate isomerase
VDQIRIRVLRNPIQTYSWGSHTAISELLGAPSPSEGPQAELWMGAHPTAPSQVITEQGEVPLDAWIARDPEAILGREVAGRFDRQLPFLFKVLAAALPLSIQAHPDRARAQAGFEAENAAGIPLDARMRCYRDPNHKPELICALTSFQALNRFRDIEEIVAGFAALGAPELEPCLAQLAERRDRQGLATFFGALTTLPVAPRARVLARAGRVARERGGRDAAWEWVRRLGDLHPGDVGGLAPLLLNLVELAPRQAMFLPAGELHSYLDGLGVELMANSDNVLRGGLTSKHVDVPELLETLSFHHGPVEVLKPEAARAGESSYASTASEFQLSILEARPGGAYDSPDRESVEVLFCAAGDARIEAIADAAGVVFARGDALLVPAALGRYRISGDATVYRAGVPGSAPARGPSQRRRVP